MYVHTYACTYACKCTSVSERQREIRNGCICMKLPALGIAPAVHCNASSGGSSPASVLPVLRTAPARSHARTKSDDTGAGMGTDTNAPLSRSFDLGKSPRVLKCTPVSPGKATSGASSQAGGGRTHRCASPHTALANVKGASLLANPFSPLQSPTLSYATMPDRVSPSLSASSSERCPSTILAQECSSAGGWQEHERWQEHEQSQLAPLTNIPLDDDIEFCTLIPMQFWFNQ